MNEWCYVVAWDEDTITNVGLSQVIISVSDNFIHRDGINFELRQRM